MVQYCCVPMCKSSALSKVSFHKFPRCFKFKKIWALKIRRHPKKSKLSNEMRVCGLHFMESDYRQLLSGRKFLKKDAVPTIFPFIKINETRRHTYLNKDRNESIEPGQVTEKTENLTHQAENITDSISQNNPPNFESLGLLADVCSKAKEDIILNSSSTLILQAQLERAEKEVSRLRQVNLEVNKRTQDISRYARFLERQMAKEVSLRFCLENIINRPNALNFYTGFNSREVFEFFLNFIAVTPEECNPDEKLINGNENILYLLSKLRQGFSNEDLAYRTNKSLKTVSLSFKKTLRHVYTRLGSIKIFPHRDIILKNSPKSFSEKFPKTFLILDGTEFRIEVPSDRVLQSQSFSPYKSSNTLKGLVGIEPRGGIIFISHLYTGSISDKDICKKSGLFDFLKQKISVGEIHVSDNVMVDKGFTITKELESIGLEVNIPVFASVHQFSTDEVKKTRKIASCRINVERSIRKIKTYKILKGTLPITLMPHINEIWTVVCLLCNFRNFTNS